MERAVSTNPMCESTGKSLLTIRVEHVPKGSESLNLVIFQRFLVSSVARLSAVITVRFRVRRRNHLA
jgi:hypothetical protein